MDKAFDIADSTDWLPTSLPSFAPLESALRCQVCKDFYDTPMITSCSHTFCSLCIRKCLSSDGKCPTCRASDQASKLRRNWTVQEVVDTFQTARPVALNLAKRGAEEHTECEPRRNAKKRKLEHVEVEQVAEDELHRPRTRSQRRTAPTSPDANVIVIDDDEDEDGEYTPEDGLVSCPVCSGRMKEEAVFAHLDKCDGTPPSNRTGDTKARMSTTSDLLKAKHPKPQRSTPQETARLTQLNYSLIKDQAFRKKLQELGIPSWGPRSLLVKRHIEWVDIYNANCDSMRPRSTRELLHDLGIWERSQGGHAPGGINSGGSQTSSVMRKDFDGHGWAENNKDQFEDLIKRARWKPGLDSASSENKMPESSGATPELRTMAPPATPPRAGDNSSATCPANVITASPTRADFPELHRNDSLASASSTTSASKFSADPPPPAQSIFSSAAREARRNSISAIPSSSLLPKVSPAESFSSMNGTSPVSPQRNLSAVSGCSQEPTSRNSSFSTTKMPMFQVPQKPVADVECGAVGDDKSVQQAFQ